MIAVEIIMYVAAALCITLGILQVKEKGPLINNAWIYANKELPPIGNSISADWNSVDHGWIILRHKELYFSYS